MRRIRAAQRVAQNQMVRGPSGAEAATSSVAPMGTITQNRRKTITKVRTISGSAPESCPAADGSPPTRAVPVHRGAFQIRNPAHVRFSRSPK